MTQETAATRYVRNHAPREQVDEALQMLGLVEDEPSSGRRCAGCGRVNRDGRNCSRCRVGKAT